MRVLDTMTTSPSSATLGDDPAFVPEPLQPMPAFGDERPGRPRRRLAALVINPDPSERLRLSCQLERAGFEVQTCAGPTGWVLCPALQGRHAMPCSRVPKDVVLIQVDQASARRPFLEAYASWRPTARIVVTSGL